MKNLQLKRPKSGLLKNSYQTKMENNQGNTPITDDIKEEQNLIIIKSNLKALFFHYSNNLEYLSCKEFKKYLGEATLYDKNALTEEYGDVLFYTISNAKNCISFTEFYQLMKKISEIKCPDEFFQNQGEISGKFHELYIKPVLKIFCNPEKYTKTITRSRMLNTKIPGDDYSFIDMNYQQMISKMSNLLIKDVIESNYLLFLKIYQKYFCFENLKISKAQKSSLSCKAFIKSMVDFGICPLYLTKNQIEEIYINVIDNKDFGEEVINKLINRELCNNDGMLFTLYHFIIGLYLISLMNIIVTNFKTNTLEGQNLWELFLDNNDVQGFESILKVLYQSNNLENVMPEDIRKMQMEILSNKNKKLIPQRIEITKENEDNIDCSDTNKIQLPLKLENSSTNNINSINNNKNSITLTSEKSKTIENSTQKNVVQKNKINNKRLINIKDMKISNVPKVNESIKFNIDYSSKLTGNQNKPLSINEITKIIIPKYSEQLITIYKFYSELYLETIFSIYMTQNGFVNFIKDLNLLEPKSFNINELTPEEKIKFEKIEKNFLSYSTINLLFSKFSYLSSNKQLGNKRINFTNFVNILVVLSNKMYNTQFNCLSFKDKEFSFEDLINKSIPIKYAYNFVETNLQKLYNRIKVIVEAESFNRENIRFLFNSNFLKNILQKLIPLFVRVLKNYNDNKNFISYNEYFKCLSDFKIFPDLVQRKKMIKVYINFIDNFDEEFLLKGDNKILLDVDSCAEAIIFIGISTIDEKEKNNQSDILFKLLNFIQRIAQSPNLGKVSAGTVRNNLQRNFISTFYDIKNYINNA